MTSAAADPWKETEDADDFWDDDLGSINDGWEVADEPSEYTAQTVSSSTAQTPSTPGKVDDNSAPENTTPEKSIEVEKKSDESTGAQATPAEPTLMPEESESTPEESELTSEEPKEAKAEISGLFNKSLSAEGGDQESHTWMKNEDVDEIDGDEVGVLSNSDDIQSASETPAHKEVEETLINEVSKEIPTQIAEPLVVDQIDPVSAEDPPAQIEPCSSINGNHEASSVDSLQDTNEITASIPMTPSKDDPSVPKETTILDSTKAAPEAESSNSEAVLQIDDENTISKGANVSITHASTEQVLTDTNDHLIDEKSLEDADSEASASLPDQHTEKLTSECLTSEIPLKQAPEAPAPKMEEAEIKLEEATLPESIDLESAHPGNSQKVPTASAEPETEKQVQINHSASSDESEVVRLRNQLSLLQSELKAKSSSIISNSDGADKSLESKLAEVERERDDAKNQLEGFLSKISSMKTVVRNYKLTQQELEETQQEVSQLKEKNEALEREKVSSEEENLQLLVEKEKLEKRVTVLETESEKSTSTILELKTKSNDLNSECERLSSQLSSLRRESNSKDQTSQDEKYALENEVSKLSKKISEIRASYNELEIAEGDVRMENKNLSLVIEELKGSLETKQKDEEKYTALIESNKEAFENEKNTLQSKIEEIDLNLQDTQKQLAQSREENNELIEKIKDNEEKMIKLSEENEQIKQLQEDIHSKQVIIGKLRHEAVILNEHLTKSLSMLKQNSGDSESTVDKELVSNLIVKFVQIPRGDTKKFETLSLIAGLLSWDDTRKAEAGLVNSGSKSGEDGKPPARSSFISLWTDFLDKESKNKT